MTVYLNGSFMPIEQAQVPVLDRGFIFGDGVYEVIPVYSRRPFRLDGHLSRLQNSLDGIRLPNPYAKEHWAALIAELIERNASEDQYLYLHITRGVAQRDHPFPCPPVLPTVFLMSSPLNTPPAQLLQSGVSAITATDNRWLRCDIKAISLLPNLLLRQLAVDADCSETILFREDLYLTEGTASNIFVVKNGCLLTPPKSHLMLPGVTYDVLLELAVAHGVSVEMRQISKDELLAADELFLTSSTRELQPITRVDGQAISNGRPGAVFARMNELYQSFKREVMRGV
jgi:D-alanine transaminase